VLYKSTKTKYPVIYDTQRYKIIQLNQH